MSRINRMWRRAWLSQTHMRAHCGIGRCRTRTGKIPVRHRSGTVSQVPHLSHRSFGSTMQSPHGDWPRNAPSGIRTRATTLKGWRPGPLVDGGGRSEDTRGRSYHPWPVWAVSSAGRAPALHAGGRRFESCTAHLDPFAHAETGQRCEEPRNLRTRAAPGAAPEIGRAGHVRAPESDVPTSGVTGSVPRSPGRSEMVAAEESSARRRAFSSALVTIRRRDLTRI